MSCHTKPDPWPIKSVGFGWASNFLALGKQSLIHAAKNVFAGLFHIRGNNNYSIIELFDTYIMETWRKNSPDTFKNVASNEGTNLNNEP